MKLGETRAKRIPGFLEKLDMAGVTVTNVESLSGLLKVIKRALC